MSNYLKTLVQYTNISNEYNKKLLHPHNQSQSNELKNELSVKLNSIDPNMMIIGPVPTSVENIEGYMPSINDLINTETDIDKVVIKKVIRTYILNAAYKYLSINQKSRALTDQHAINMLTEYIVDDCGSLELREIEFIFKNGIMGKFGIIYNDISIDTICGVDGWIEKYYKDFRPKRKEIVREYNENYDNCISKEEFYNLAPEYKNISKNIALIEKAKKYTLTLLDVKLFYNDNMITTYDQDIADFNKEYESLEDKDSITNEAFILYKFSQVIISYENMTTDEMKKYKIAQKGKNITESDVTEFYSLIGQDKSSYLADKRYFIDVYNEKIPCDFGDIKKIKNNYPVEIYLKECFSKLIKSIVKW